MAVEVTQLLKELIADILGNRDSAFQFVSDPGGKLVAQGITEGDLSGVNVPALVGQVCQEAGGTYPTALQSYTSGGPAPASSPVTYPPSNPGNQSVEQVIQHLNYVTYSTYEGDEIITQIITDNSTNIDNSIDFDVHVDGDNHGDITFDSTNVNATGDGAVAVAGDGDVNAATGDGAQIIDGDNHGLANTGDGAVLVDGPNNGVINTGVNTGVIADGDVGQAVIGDNNNTAQINGPTDGTVINFGDGAVSNINDSTITDSAIATGGDATNVSNNDVSDGSAIAVGGDASGSFEDNDTTHVDVDLNFVQAHDSIVTTEQGPGDQHVETTLESEPEPV